MTYSQIEIFLANLSFFLLFFAMLLYWSSSNSNSHSVRGTELDSASYIGATGDEKKSLFERSGSGLFGPLAPCAKHEPEGLVGDNIKELGLIPPPYGVRALHKEPAKHQGSDQPLPDPYHQSTKQVFSEGEKSTKQNKPFKISPKEKDQGHPIEFLKFLLLISKKFSIVLSLFCITLLMILRFVESGHLPLSNLYESLMFLSWSCIIIHLIIEKIYVPKMQEQSLALSSISGLPSGGSSPFRACAEHEPPFFLERRGEEEKSRCSGGVARRARSAKDMPAQQGAKDPFGWREAWGRRGLSPLSKLDFLLYPIRRFMSFSSPFRACAEHEPPFFLERRGEEEKRALVSGSEHILTQRSWSWISEPSGMSISRGPLVGLGRAFGLGVGSGPLPEGLVGDGEGKLGGGEGWSDPEGINPNSVKSLQTLPKPTETQDQALLVGLGPLPEGLVGGNIKELGLIPSGSDQPLPYPYHQSTKPTDEQPYPLGKSTVAPQNMLSLFISPATISASLFINGFATFSLPPEMQQASPLVPALQSNWLMMHVSVMILSYAALMLGSLLAIVYLIIFYFWSPKGSSEIGNFFSNFAMHSIPEYPYRRLIRGKAKAKSRVVFSFSGLLVWLGLVGGNIKELGLIPPPHGEAKHQGSDQPLPYPYHQSTSSSPLLSRKKGFGQIPYAEHEGSTTGAQKGEEQDMPKPEGGRGGHGYGSAYPNAGLPEGQPLPLSPLLLGKKEKRGKEHEDEQLLTLASAGSSEGHKPGASVAGPAACPLPYRHDEPALRADMPNQEPKPRRGEDKHENKHKDKQAKFRKENMLDLVDNVSYRLLGIGFPLLTIGILSGAVWANEAWGSYWSWDPKETWALLTWLIFAIYLHIRITKGWQGQKAAFLASLGFFTVWICFLGVNLIGEGLHSYGWFAT